MTGREVCNRQEMSLGFEILFWVLNQISTHIISFSCLCSSFLKIIINGIACLVHKKYSSFSLLLSSFLSFNSLLPSLFEIYYVLSSIPFSLQRLVFWHQEVASDSFCFLINSPWLSVFILYFFFLFFSGFNLYCWKGIHFS